MSTVSEVQPQEGDIIKFQRLGYAHFGIYVGNGRVIHRSGPPGTLSADSMPVYAFSASGARSDEVLIRDDDLAEIAGDDKVEIWNFLDDEYTPYSGKEVVERARSKLGEKGYNLLFKNCEHFATWCRYDREISLQVDGAINKVGRLVRTPTVFLITKLTRLMPNHFRFQ